MAQPHQKLNASIGKLPPTTHRKLCELLNMDHSWKRLAGVVPNRSGTGERFTSDNITWVWIVDGCDNSIFESLKLRIWCVFPCVSSSFSTLLTMDIYQTPFLFVVATMLMYILIACMLCLYIVSIQTVHFKMLCREFEMQRDPTESLLRSWHTDYLTFNTLIHWLSVAQLIREACLVRKAVDDTFIDFPGCQPCNCGMWIPYLINNAWWKHW